MFTLDVSGIERLILQLEKRSEDYQVAVDSAVELAQETILRRVKLGQLSDGSYRVSNSSPLDGRYSDSWGSKRRIKPLSVNTHTLFFNGDLHKNFIIKKTKSVNKKNLTFARTIEFTNRQVRGKKITYAELAAIQEAKTGIGFQLSPSQLVRVMARFKQVARL
jgi:hypothetical protein